MEGAAKRLTALRPLVEEMMARTGTAGLTYGVIHHGNVLLTENFGYRNVDQKLPVNEDTVFQVASFTKSMIAAAVGMLVEDQKLTWDTPIKDILPEWTIQDQIVRDHTTIVDCLAHRTGLQMNNYWLESNNNIIVPPENSMKFLSGLIPVKPFRGQFQYNNLGYELVGHVIRKVSGRTWSQFLQEELFDPIGMNRTGTHHGFCDPENVSKCYGALSSGKPVQIADAQIGDNTMAGAAGGVRSCLSDMLRYIKVWLDTSRHQFENQVSVTPGSPLRQVNYLTSARISTDYASYRETSYAMGWARTQLPGPMGVVGLNGLWLPGRPGTPSGMPIVGRSGKSQLVIYHQGSNPGVLATMNLLPESGSAVVVLTNTLALNDCADWVGQMLLEAYLDTPQKNNYRQINEDTVSQALNWYPKMAKILRQNRPTKIPRQPASYTGVYENQIGTVHINVEYEDDQLGIVFQGVPRRALGSLPLAR